MRIITGKYRGRHFDIPRTFKARPTTDFAKENIFNVLMGYIDFDGATALDLFAGTGSITLELLSRGCREVVSIELDRDHHRFIQQCLKTLSAQAPYGDTGVPALAAPGVPSLGAVAIRTDVFRYLKSCHRQFDIIFADPPYALRELPQIPDIIFQRQMLAEGGIFVFEHGKTHDFSTHPHYVDHRAYGSVNFTLFK